VKYVIYSYSSMFKREVFITVYNGQAVYRAVICRYKGLAQYFGGPTVLFNTMCCST
jgi:hypothetical protein